MQTEKQIWVEEVLNSADGAVRAQSSDMTDAVMSRLGTAREYTISPVSNDNSLIWRIAASVALLLLLNVVTIYSYLSNIKRSAQVLEVRAAASEFGLGQSAASDPAAAIFGN
jgi:hypothetical protein